MKDTLVEFSKNNPLLNSNVVFIISGISGSGKSTLAEFLDVFLGDTHETEVCCADDYHMVNGEYVFDVNNLTNAHNQCKDKYIKSLQSGTRFVIVSNTNTTDWEKRFYKQHAEQYGYIVFEVITNNGFKDIHSVPQIVVEKQRKQIIKSIK